MSSVFWVSGLPAPQGSKKAFPRGKKTVLVEMSKKVGPWRAAVAAAARPHHPTPHDCPVIVTIDFFMKRPQRMPKGRTVPSVPPDIDKLARSTLDALTGIAFKDDGLVVSLVLTKEYELDRGPGARISVTPLGTPTGSLFSTPIVG
jgi:crossover junction endodeoxyribonuclease RusA